MHILLHLSVLFQQMLDFKKLCVVEHTVIASMCVITIVGGCGFHRTAYNPSIALLEMQQGNFYVFMKNVFMSCLRSINARLILVMSIL